MQAAFDFSGKFPTTGAVDGGRFFTLPIAETPSIVASSSSGTAALKVAFTTTPKMKQGIVYSSRSMTENGLEVVFEGNIPRRLGVSALRVALTASGLQGAVAVDEKLEGRMPSHAHGRDLVTVYAQVGVDSGDDDKIEGLRQKLNAPNFKSEIARKIYEQGGGRGAPTGETLSEIQRFVDGFVGGLFNLLGTGRSGNQRQPAY